MRRQRWRQRLRIRRRRQHPPRKVDRTDAVMEAAEVVVEVMPFVARVVTLPFRLLFRLLDGVP